MSKSEDILIEEYYAMGWNDKEVLEGIDDWAYGKEEAYKYMAEKLQKQVEELKNDGSMYKGGRDKWHKLYLSMKPYQEYFEMTKSLITLPDDEKEMNRLIELIELLNKQK